MSNQSAPKTLTVPEAGSRYFGLSRNGSYNAVKLGAIPVIRVGKLMRVSVAAMEHKVAAGTGEAAASSSTRSVSSHVSAKAA